MEPKAVNTNYKDMVSSKVFQDKLCNMIKIENKFNVIKDDVLNTISKRDMSKTELTRHCMYGLNIFLSLNKKNDLSFMDDQIKSLLLVIYNIKGKN